MSERQDPVVTFTTRELPGEIGLVSWLPASRGVLCWAKDGEGLTGWGEAARFTARGPGRFAQLQAWWNAFTSRAVVHDEAGLRGSGPVAFASIAFADDGGESVLIVPRVVVGRRAGVGWITTAGGAVPARQPVSAPRGVRSGPGMVDDAAHQSSVAAAIRRIRAGDLAKVVLARDLIATASEPLDERHLLTRLAASYAGCWVFAVNGLIGATPGLLLRREGRAVSSRLLAGTAWPGPGGSTAGSAGARSVVQKGASAWISD